jgi:hypothetical protein
MENLFIPYELASELKELGFDETCLAYYYNGEIEYRSHTNNIMQRFRYAAPTFSQCFRWFREKYNLHIGICHSVNGKFDCWTNDGQLLENGKYCDFNTYKEAELACLEKLIEIIKTK